jgi:hypothetical protein
MSASTSLPAVLASLRALDRRALARRFVEGAAVPDDALANRRFRGVVLGLPAIVERLSWSLFAKDIVTDDDGVLIGWNVRLRQPGPRDATTLATAPLSPLRTPDGQPRLFGPFVVTRAGDHVVIDYRGVQHRRGEALLARMADPLVVVDHVDDGRPVLLGVSRLDVAGRSVTTPTWFALVLDAAVPDPDRRVGAPLVRLAR